MLPELGIAPHDMVFVSGIGCAARLPYYMNTYGVHSIHGRAPAIATGVAMTRPDLSVWVIGGDGDMLSIGGNHLIHALRRNVNLTILMFNNQIYGLTKGQYSPTSDVGKVAKSTPFGSIDHPFNPISVAIGAEATFVARTHDSDRGHMQEVFRRAHEHRGAAFVEVYQNCNVFNDGAYDDVLRRDVRDDMLIPLEHGRPIRFGAEGQHGVAQNEYAELVVGEVADFGEDRLVVHDEHRPDSTLAFALSRLASSPHEPTPIGVFRDIERPGLRGRGAGPGRRRDRTLRPRLAVRADPLGRHLDGRVGGVDRHAPFRSDVDHEGAVGLLLVTERGIRSVSSVMAMTLRLTDEEQRALKELAAAEGVSMQDAVRRAVRDYVDAQRTPGPGRRRGRSRPRRPRRCHPPPRRVSGTTEFLDLEDALDLARRLFGEPIPLRDVGLLGSAVARPRTTVLGEEAYPTLWLKAAALLHSVVNNHALVDGNKRLGWLCAAVFLELNHASVSAASNDAVVELVVDVASGAADLEMTAERLERLSGGSR